MARGTQFAHDQIQAFREWREGETPQALSQRLEFRFKGKGKTESGAPHRGFDVERQNARRELKRHLIGPDTRVGEMFQKQHSLEDEFAQQLLDMATREELEQLDLPDWMLHILNRREAPQLHTTLVRNWHYIMASNLFPRAESGSFGHGETNLGRG